MTGAWLSEDEQRAWRTYLRMSSLLPAALNRELQQESGLTLPEYEVLVRLSETPRQRQRPFQICEALNWEQSRLSHQLTRMERRGLVSRRECEADGRGAFIELTSAGADAIGAVASRHVAAVRRLVFDRLTDAQCAAFEEACATILAALSDQPLPSGRRGLPLVLITWSGAAHALPAEVSGVSDPAVAGVLSDLVTLRTAAARRALGAWRESRAAGVGLVAVRHLCPRLKLHAVADDVPRTARELPQLLEVAALFGLVKPAGVGDELQVPPAELAWPRPRA